MSTYITLGDVRLCRNGVLDVYLMPFLLRNVRLIRIELRSAVPRVGFS